MSPFCLAPESKNMIHALLWGFEFVSSTPVLRQDILGTCLSSALLGLMPVPLELLFLDFGHLWAQRRNSFSVTFWRGGQNISFFHKSNCVNHLTKEKSTKNPKEHKPTFCTKLKKFSSSGGTRNCDGIWISQRRPTWDGNLNSVYTDRRHKLNFSEHLVPHLS